MSRKAIQILALSLFVGYPTLVMARAPQQTAATVAAAQANAQAAAAQASAAQAAYTQAATQVTAMQNAYRQALTNAAKTPAGPAQTAAQAAAQQALKNLQAAQTAARTASTNAVTAQTAAAQAAAQAASAQAALAQQAAAQQAAAKTVSTTSGSSASSTSKAGGTAAPANSAVSEFNSVFSTITGGGSAGKSAGGGAASAAGASGGTGSAAGTTPGGNAAVASNGKGGRSGAQPSAAGAPNATVDTTAPAQPARKVGSAFTSGALGMGQASDSLLTVYGCTRMGTQVACDTDFSNQNNSVTQVSSADQWKDVYLQDDAGDNHMRSMAVFENSNGDQRTQVTLPYGEKSRYILLFNGVPANVKTVTLKSTANVLDVESIPVSAPSQPAAGGQTGGDPPGAVVQPASGQAPGPAGPVAANAKVPHS